MGLHKHRLVINRTSGSLQFFPSGSSTIGGVQAGGATSTYEISCSYTSQSAATDGFLQSGSSDYGTMLQLEGPSGHTLNILFISTSISSSAQLNFPMSSSYSCFTMSVHNHTSASLTQLIESQLYPAYSHSLGHRTRTGAATRTLGQNMLVPWSMSYHHAGGQPAMRFFSQRKGRVNFRINSGSAKYNLISSSLQYTVLNSGSGHYMHSKSGHEGMLHLGTSPLIKPTAQFEIDPQDRTSLIISGSKGGKIYLSGSGRIGIGTKDPKQSLDFVTSNTTGTGSFIDLTYNKANLDPSEGPGAPNLPQIGDFTGGIRWRQISGSSGVIEEELMASMHTVINDVQNDGLTGDLEIQVSPATDAKMQTAMRFRGKNNIISITGSKPTIFEKPVTMTDLIVTGSLTAKGSLVGSSTTGDQSGSLTLSGSLILRPNAATPAASSSALYSSGSNQLYWGGNSHEPRFPVAPKQLMFFPHGMSDTNLTTKHYVPWQDTNEQTTAYSPISQFIAPCDMVLKKVMMVTGQWSGGDTVVSMSLERWRSGVSNLSGTPDMIGQVTKTYDHSEMSNHTLLFDFENDRDGAHDDNKIFTGQRALIGFKTEDDVQVGAGYMNLTSVWEADYSTLITGSFA